MESFKDDQDALDKPVDFSDKRQELENKFKKEELKKCEKPVRKEINEWDDLFNGGPGLRKNQKGLDTLAEKINKMMKGSVAKSMKTYNVIY